MLVIASNQFFNHISLWGICTVYYCNHRRNSELFSCIDDESVEVAIIPHLEKNPYNYPLYDAPGGNDFSVSNTVQMCTVKEKCVSQ